MARTICSGCTTRCSICPERRSIHERGKQQARRERGLPVRARGAGARRKKAAERQEKNRAAALYGDPVRRGLRDGAGFHGFADAKFPADDFRTERNKIQRPVQRRTAPGAEPRAAAGQDRPAEPD